MKKTTWTVLGVLFALVVIFFSVKDEPVKEVKPPLVIDTVADLQRIEVVPPDSQDDAARPDLIVFEKADDAWTLTNPVESDLRDSFATKLDAAFAHPIQTDDFKLSADKKDEYGLTEQTRVRVSLFARGADQPAVELMIGEQIQVPQTGVERTYISKVGKDGLYRAQAALGDLFREPLDDIRSREILAMPEDAITAVTIEHPDGTTLTLARDKTDWTLERGGEPVDFELDDSSIKSALRTYTSLTASGFFDPGETDTEALGEPGYTVEIAAGPDSRTLRVGQTTDGKRAFVAIDDTPYSFEIRRSAFDALTADAMYFRTRPGEPHEASPRAGESPPRQPGAPKNPPEGLKTPSGSP